MHGVFCHFQIPTTSAEGIRKKLRLENVWCFFAPSLHWEWEVPDILEQNHLLDKEESRDVLEALEASNDPEQVLRGLVRKAYFQYYRRPNGTH